MSEGIIGKSQISDVPTRVATRSGKSLENEKFSFQGKVREFHFQSGKFRGKNVNEKSGNE